jgi:hypothetical protein
LDGLPEILQDGAGAVDSGQPALPHLLENRFTPVANFQAIDHRCRIM